MSSHRDSENLTKRIVTARQEARHLYTELEKVRRRVQDTNLIEFSKTLESLKANQTHLRLHTTLKGHRSKIAKIRWGSDSHSLLSASQDGFLIIWDVVTGLKKNAIPLDNQWVLTCAYSPNRRLVASAGLDNVCTIYNVNEVQNQPERTTSNNRINNNQESYQMIGGLTQSIRSIFKGHTAYISDCNFVNDNMILTASGDMTCVLWDISKGCKTREFVDHLGDVLCLTNLEQYNHEYNTHNNNLFISGASDGYARIWDSRQQNPAQSFFVSHSDVNCLKGFPDGHSFVSGSDDGFIRLFDLRSDCELANYSLSKKGSKSTKAASPSYSSINIQSTPTTSPDSSSFSTMDVPGVNSLEFSKSGRILYACYADNGCLIWDTLKSELIGSLEGHGNRVNEVACSPDGLGLVTASWDSTIKVWST